MLRVFIVARTDKPAVAQALAEIQPWLAQRCQVVGVESDELFEIHLRVVDENLNGVQSGLDQVGTQHRKAALPGPHLGWWRGSALADGRRSGWPVQASTWRTSSSS